MNKALRYLDKDISSTIEFEEFLKFAEFSWKFVAANKNHVAEPGSKKNPFKKQRSHSNSLGGLTEVQELSEAMEQEKEKDFKMGNDQKVIFKNNYLV